MAVRLHYRPGKVPIFFWFENRTKLSAGAVTRRFLMLMIEPLTASALQPVEVC
jgi:hypothetical protein